MSKGKESICLQGLQPRDAVVMLWAWHHFGRKLPLDALEALLRCMMAGTGSEAGLGALDSITTRCGLRSRPPLARADHRFAQARCCEVPCLYEVYSMHPDAALQGST